MQVIFLRYHEPLDLQDQQRREIDPVSGVSLSTQILDSKKLEIIPRVSPMS
jgi:hypothetical protein